MLMQENGIFHECHDVFKCFVIAIASARDHMHVTCSLIVKGVRGLCVFCCVLRSLHSHCVIVVHSLVVVAQSHRPHCGGSVRMKRRTEELKIKMRKHGKG